MALTSILGNLLAPTVASSGAPTSTPGLDSATFQALKALGPTNIQAMADDEDVWGKGNTNDNLDTLATALGKAQSGSDPDLLSALSAAKADFNSYLTNPNADDSLVPTATKAYSAYKSFLSSPPPAPSTKTPATSANPLLTGGNSAPTPPVSQADQSLLNTTGAGQVYTPPSSSVDAGIQPTATAATNPVLAFLDQPNSNQTGDALLANPGNANAILNPPAAQPANPLLAAYSTPQANAQPAAGPDLASGVTLTPQAQAAQNAPLTVPGTESANPLLAGGAPQGAPDPSQAPLLTGPAKPPPYQVDFTQTPEYAQLQGLNAQKQQAMQDLQDARTGAAALTAPDPSGDVKYGTKDLVAGGLGALASLFVRGDTRGKFLAGLTGGYAQGKQDDADSTAQENVRQYQQKQNAFQAQQQNALDRLNDLGSQANDLTNRMQQRVQVQSQFALAAQQAAAKGDQNSATLLNKLADPKMDSQSLMGVVAAEEAQGYHVNTQAPQFQNLMAIAAQNDLQKQQVAQAKITNAGNANDIKSLNGALGQAEAYLKNEEAAQGGIQAANLPSMQDHLNGIADAYGIDRDAMPSLMAYQAIKGKLTDAQVANINSQTDYRGNVLTPNTQAKTNLTNAQTGQIQMHMQYYPAQATQNLQKGQQAMNIAQQRLDVLMQQGNFRDALNSATAYQNSMHPLYAASTYNLANYLAANKNADPVGSVDQNGQPDKNTGLLPAVLNSDGSVKDPVGYKLYVLQHDNNSLKTAMTNNAATIKSLGFSAQGQPKNNATGGLPVPQGAPNLRGPISLSPLHPPAPPPQKRVWRKIAPRISVSEG